MGDRGETETSCTQRAYLFFARDGSFGDPPYSIEQLDRMAFDPDLVTERVGLSPTSCCRRGDAHPNPAFAGGRRFSDWKYELPAEQTYVSEDVVLALLDVVEPFAETIMTTCRELQLRAGIMVVIEMGGYIDADGEAIVSTAAIGCSRDTIHRLARLDLSLEHDQYVDVPPAVVEPLG